MKIGYARVSTQDQKLELQKDALTKAGCETIFEEKMSGKTKERPQLQEMFEKFRKGDTLVVWKLDRLGRSLKDLIELVTKLKEKGVTFLSINDSIDTKTATGRFTFNVFASLAEFEREMIRERTMAGLLAARARGRMGGRPKGLSKTSILKAKMVKTLYDTREKTMDQIGEGLGLSRATCYRYLEIANELEKTQVQEKTKGKYNSNNLLKKKIKSRLNLTKRMNRLITKSIALKEISAKRLLLFFVIAFVISNIFRFNIFHLDEILEKDSKWSYLVLRGILEGSGIFIAGLMGLHLLRKQRKVEISFLGTSRSKSLLMASIPTALLIVIGVQNKYGINSHLYGFIAAVGTFIYCIMEEYGWRGYLQSELQFLRPIIKFLLIGSVWYSWHLIFLMETTLMDNLLFLGTLILGSWGIGKIAEITDSILACSCFHLIVNIFMYNSFFNNAFSGTSKFSILIISILLWVFILVKWTRDKRDNGLLT